MGQTDRVFGAAYKPLDHPMDRSGTAAPTLFAAGGAASSLFSGRSAEATYHIG